MRTRDAISQACALLEQFGLAGRSGSLMLRLSGGERQMVFLLSTFMGHRSLVILDEPTSNLDPVRRRLVWDFLRERAHEGIAIILVTSRTWHEIGFLAAWTLFSLWAASRKLAWRASE